MDKSIETIEMHTLVVAAEIRMSIDCHVKALEARMIYLVGRLEAARDKELGGLRSQRKDVADLILDATTRLKDVEGRMSEMAASELEEAKRVMTDQLDKVDRLVVTP